MEWQVPATLKGWICEIFICLSLPAGKHASLELLLQQRCCQLQSCPAIFQGNRLYYAIPDQ